MSHCIEYFATIGPPPGALQYKLWEREPGSGKYTINPRDLWGQAITDVAFVMGKEAVPPNQGWEVITHSVDHREMNPPHLAIRRRNHSNRLDHITQIILVPAADKAPKGFEVIKHSISGVYSAFLNPLGFVAIQRAENSAAAYMQGEPFIDDFCLALLYHDEDIPEEYLRAAKYVPPRSNNDSLSSTMGSLSLSLGGAFGGGRVDSGGSVVITEKSASDVVALSYHLRPPMGLCDLNYTACTLDRFPTCDIKGHELPVKELSMFAFPNDLKIEFGLTHHQPKESFFTFVFTDSNGNNMFAACLMFYEALEHQDVSLLFESLYGADKAIRILPGTAIYCPKVICVMSTKPYYRAMRRFLQQLFSMSISSLPYPIEYYIASVVGQVPLPVEGGRPFHVTLDICLISHSSRPMSALVFDLPHRDFFPLLDLDFAAPFRCLSTDNILAIFTLLLEEAKVLFISTSNTLLTETMEVLRALLFPLSWPGTFVSRLPVHMSTYLEAPGGFLIGIHLPPDFSSLQKKSQHYRSFQDESILNGIGMKIKDWLPSIVHGTYIVDLTSNKIARLEQNSEVILLNPPRVSTLVKALPLGARRRLTRKLDAICDEFLLGPQAHGLEHFDEVFGTAANAHLSGNMISGVGITGLETTEKNSRTSSSSPIKSTKLRRWGNVFPAIEVRDSFMQLMIDIIGPSYTRFIVPPPDDLAADTYRTFQESFAVEPFLAEADKELRPLLARLLETQMFAFFIQQRAECTHPSIGFFEAAAEILRDFGLSCGGRTNNESAVATFYTRSKGVDLELPAPLYKLLAADVRWTQSSPHYQDLVLGAYLKLVQTETRKTQFVPSLTSPLAALSTGPSRERSTSNTSSAPNLSFDTTDTGGVETTIFSIGRDANSRSRRFGAVGLVALESALCMLRHLEDHGLELMGLGDFAIKTANKLDPHFHETASNFGEVIRGSVGDREEIARGYDLQLHDSSYGPIIIPGPIDMTQTAIHAHKNINSLVRRTWLDEDYVGSKSVSWQLSSREVETPACFGEERARFSYPHGWPSLNSLFFEEAVKGIHSKVKLLREVRRFSLDQGRKFCNSVLWCRCPGERLGFSHNGRLSSSLPHYCPNVATTALGPVQTVQAFPQTLSYESQTVLASVRDVVAVSCLMLSLRVDAGRNPIPDILQVLGIFSQCEYLGLLGHIDEVVFRGVLASCAAQGGEFMRRVAVVVLDILVWAGATAPTAQSYGLYLKALGTKKERLSENHSTADLTLLDPYLYMEEMGFEWLIQHLTNKDELMRNSREMPSHEHVTTVSSPRERLLSSSSFFDSVNTSLHSPPSPEREQTKCLNSPLIKGIISSHQQRFLAADAAKRLHLAKDAGLLSLVGPEKLRWPSLPRAVSAIRAKTLLSGCFSEPFFIAAKTLSDNVSISLVTRIAKVKSQTENMLQFGVSSDAEIRKETLIFDDQTAETQNKTSVEQPGTYLNTFFSDQRTSISLEKLGFSDEESEEEIEKDSTRVCGTGNAAMIVPTDTHAMNIGRPVLSHSIISDDNGSGDLPCIFPQRSNSIHFSGPPLHTKTSSSGPNLSTPKVIDPIKSLQDQVLSILEAEAQARGRAVGIFSRTPCECGHAMLDEEVLAFWVGYGHCQLNTNLGAKDLHAAHRVLCPDCHRDTAPLLHVRCYEANLNLESTSPSLETCWSVEVVLLSPFGLRYGLEEVWGLVGDKTVDGRWLYHYRPELFWCLYWYTTRLRLPTGLLPNNDESDIRSPTSETGPGSWAGPVVLAWRESVVEAQIFRVLNSPAPSADILTLKDVFPNCTKADVEAARHVMSAMDGSTVGTRNALRTLVTIPNITRDAGEGEGGGGARIARSLYVGLLTLTFLFKPEMLAANATDPISVQLALGKVVPFDRNFIDTVKCVLSTEDYAFLGTSDRHLLDAVATRCEQSMRLAFGFLY